MRYFVDQKKKYFLAGTRYEVGYFKWFGRNYNETTFAFEDITPYLRSIGITENDKVITPADASFNITLYLMNNKGWTGFGNGIDSEEEIRDKIRHGAKYLLISDSTMLNAPSIKPFTGTPVGRWKNVRIFALIR